MKTYSSYVCMTHKELENDLKLNYLEMGNK